MNKENLISNQPHSGILELPGTIQVRARAMMIIVLGMCDHMVGTVVDKCKINTISETLFYWFKAQQDLRGLLDFVF